MAWCLEYQEAGGKEDAKLSDQQKSLLLLLAKKKSRKEGGPLDLNPYRKGYLHFGKRDDAVNLLS